jgi:predicted N-acetyltransferase YhbS
MENIKKGRWRHFKGHDYEVLYNARHSESLEPMIVYRALYGEGGVWVRPAAMWSETVTHQGVPVPRFTYTGDMALSLRPEEPRDYTEAENITREAFWNKFKPGCDEHYLLHAMRGDPSFIPELDIVAEKDGRLIGSIVYAKGHVLDHRGLSHEVITFGPVSVLPGYQKSGVGARLIFHTLDLARQLGYGAVIILGHPDYYPRFGFRRARDFGLTTKDGDTFDPFMALELQPGSLSGLGGGVFHDSDVYTINPAEAEAFDQAFPYKEKKAAEIQI